MFNDAFTDMGFDNGISVRYKDFASSSSVGKNGPPGSECRKKLPDKTLHFGQVFPKYFCPAIFENLSRKVGTLFWMYDKTSLGSSTISDNKQISFSVSSTCGAKIATTGILESHRQQ